MESNPSSQSKEMFPVSSGDSRYVFTKYNTYLVIMNLSINFENVVYFGRKTIS